MKSLFFLLLFGACGYNNTEVPSAQDVEVGPSTPDQLSFGMVQEQVFQPSCVRCHGSSGGVSLTSYAAVQPALARIRSAVSSGTMPPSGGLSQNAKNLVIAWIDAGAPETAGTATTAGGTAPGGASGGSDCEDDDRLLAAELVLPVGGGLVYDREQQLIRPLRDGCDDD